MNPDIKQKWVTALRSGDFMQGSGALLYENGLGDMNFCCLGVLCSLATNEGVIGYPQKVEKGEWEYDGQAYTLPEKVIKWAGLNDPDPEIDIAEETGTKQTLAWFNDHDRDFETIANLIDEKL